MAFIRERLALQGKTEGRIPLPWGGTSFGFRKIEERKVSEAGESRKTTLGRGMGKCKGREKGNPEDRFTVSFFRETIKGHGILGVENWARWVDRK